MPENNVIFRKSYTMRTADFDRFGAFQPSSVLDLFQDIAGLHSRELGIYTVERSDHTYIWILARVKYVVEALPDCCSEVKTETWPRRPERSGFRRDYRIMTEEGKLLVNGTADWILADVNERRFAQVPDVYPFNDEYFDAEAVPGKLTRIHDFEPEGEPYNVVPGASCLDVNGHVNNTKYANFMIDALNPGRDDIIGSLQIDYSREVLCGDRLSILQRRDESGASFRGINSDGARMFSGRIDFMRGDNVRHYE